MYEGLVLKKQVKPVAAVKQQPWFAGKKLQTPPPCSCPLARSRCGLGFDTEARVHGQVPAPDGNRARLDSIRQDGAIIELLGRLSVGHQACEVKAFGLFGLCRSPALLPSSRPADKPLFRNFPMLEWDEDEAFSSLPALSSWQLLVLGAVHGKTPPIHFSLDRGPAWKLHFRCT